MIRIAHVSDLHFHSDNANNQGAISLLDLVRNGHSFEDQNDFLIVTGDITDDGLDLQYANALAELQKFSCQVLLTPGNHDYGLVGNFYDPVCAQAFEQNLLRPLTGAAHPFSQKTPKVDLLDDGCGTKVLAVGLNSVLETTTPVDFARGEIGGNQLDDLQNTLSDPAYAECHKLVYLHHRPLGFNGWFFDLLDAADLQAILAQNGVKAVAFGHTGGSMRDKEPPQSRIVRAWTKPYGVKYWLNANTSVEAQKYNEIVYNQNQINVRTV